MGMKGPPRLPAGARRTRLLLAHSGTCGHLRT
jgi:hypothetical protein